LIALSDCVRDCDDRSSAASNNESRKIAHRSPVNQHCAALLV
jgi:hypothetical protein